MKNRLEKIYSKARTTLKILMKKLLLKKQFYVIDKQYKLAGEDEQKTEILIKVLNRCIKMGESVSELYKLIGFIEDRFQKFNELKELLKKDHYDPRKLATIYKDLLRFSSRILSTIRVLKSA